MMPDAEAFNVSRSIRRHLLGGGVAGVMLVVGAGAWASVTSLSAAVIAQGHFVVGSHVKKVQHQTGGIVGEILVQDGDRVEAGAPLIRLDSTQTRANLAIVTKRLEEMMARMARLQAEQNDQAQIVFPAELSARNDRPDVAAVIQAEIQLFEARKRSRSVKQAQLLERITQFEREIDGLKAQQLAYEEGLRVLTSEINALSSLKQKGIVSDQRLNSLKTQAATFGGERGEKIAFQAQVAGRISETRLQILQIDQDLKSEVGRERSDIQAQLGEYAERRISAEDNLKRIDIVAPQSGVVHQLAVHTVGGVISPAQEIMSIVPDEDGLVLEVQIAPKDIDQVRIGQLAMLRMSAFSQRTTPQLEARVTRIAADLDANEQTGAQYYRIHLSVVDAESKKMKNLRIVPGMPAEAMLKTQDRTALSYLVKPFQDQIMRAFREE